mmetsp:Transcript_146742/g.470923  ORF Transcript_146742/g.470923 Transcript_146742/m.470923 type:complete len:236 (-) Transcript_146742:36-743(-)
MASAAAVRQHYAGKEADTLDHKPSRNVDKKTGALEIYASADDILQWLPKFDNGLCATWCRIPIFKVRMFRNREAFDQGGLDRCYVEQVFPEGEDLVTTVVWWRKRIREEGKGFAVFEGGFDLSGQIHLTEPPRCFVDAASGEVRADDDVEIERKRTLHGKRRGMDARWAKKGHSEELLSKISSAEARGNERKRRGEAFALRGGWVAAPRVSAAGAGVLTLDVAKHNEYQKKFGCK